MQDLQSSLRHEEVLVEERGIQFPDQGWSLGPLRQGHGVLVTERGDFVTYQECPKPDNLFHCTLGQRITLHPCHACWESDYLKKKKKNRKKHCSLIDAKSKTVLSPSISAVLL